MDFWTKLESNLSLGELIRGMDLAHRQLGGATLIGVDEIHRGHGMKADSKKEAKCGNNMLWPFLRRESRARQSPQEAQYPARQLAGHGQRLGVEGNLPALLKVRVAPLGGRFSRCMVRTCPAQTPRAHAESCPYAAQT